MLPAPFIATQVGGDWPLGVRVPFAGFSPYPGNKGNKYGEISVDNARCTV